MLHLQFPTGFSSAQTNVRIKLVNYLKGRSSLACSNIENINADALRRWLIHTPLGWAGALR